MKLVIVIASLNLLLVAVCGAKGKEVTLSLEHSVDEETFTHRGDVELIYSPNGREYSFKVADLHRISPAESEPLQALINRDGYYRIRLRSDPLDPSSPYCMASVRACHLRLSRFREDIIVQMREDGRIRSISYGTDSNVQSCLMDNIPPVPSTGAKVRTAISVSKEDAAPSLPLVVEGPPPPGVKPDPSTQEGKAQQEGTQSFIAKYWYYLVPVAIVLLMPSGGDEGKDKAPAPQET